MKILTRAAVSVVCLLLAIACYSFGVPWGGVAFLILGFVFEGACWPILFGRRKRTLA